LKGTGSSVANDTGFSEENKTTGLPALFFYLEDGGVAEFVLVAVLKLVAVFIAERLLQFYKPV
jgi:hypothetical protein